MAKKMDADESLMFGQVRELCILAAQGIVKISHDTGIHPTLVAKMFIEVFQEVINKMEKN